MKKPSSIKTPKNCWACPVNWDCQINAITKCSIYQRYNSAYSIQKYVYNSCWPASAVDNCEGGEDGPYEMIEDPYEGMDGPF